MISDECLLSVVIPAYNEEFRIASSLEHIYVYLEQEAYRYELIVVDDGSSDRTAQIVNDVFKRIPCGTLLKNERNRGKGYSIRRGVLSSRGDYVLFSDADLSTPIENIERLLRRLQQGCDIAIGSRGLRESEIMIHQPWYREYMGKTFNLIIRILLLSDFHDTQCDFKCFRGNVARHLFAQQRIEHFSFDVEVLFLAALNNYRIEEVPVQWLNEPNSRVNALKDSLKMFEDVIKIRYNAWTGKYSGRNKEK